MKQSSESPFSTDRNQPAPDIRSGPSPITSGYSRVRAGGIFISHQLKFLFIPHRLFARICKVSKSRHDLATHPAMAFNGFSTFPK